MVTPPSAVTTPDTVLALGWAASFEAAGWSFPSADFRAVIWACHWPRACAARAVSFALTSARSALISFAVPAPTLRCVSLPSEARRAAASAHSAAFGLGAAGDAAADVLPADALPAPDGVPLDPQATASSAAPIATAAIFHQAGLVTVTRLMSPQDCLPRAAVPHPQGAISPGHPPGT